MILSKFLFGPSKAILRIASKVLLPTQWALNHSPPTPKFDPSNHQKHPQLTINLPTWKSSINVPRTSMHPQTSTLNLQSIYCQDMATITIITIATHNCKTKRNDEEKNQHFSQPTSITECWWFNKAYCYRKETTPYYYNYKITCYFPLTASSS
jgi:hypothetical protein